jgi:hypothetical protein
MLITLIVGKFIFIQQLKKWGAVIDLELSYITSWLILKYFKIYVYLSLPNFRYFINSTKFDKNWLFLIKKL